MAIGASRWSAVLDHGTAAEIERMVSAAFVKTETVTSGGMRVCARARARQNLSTQCTIWWKIKRNCIEIARENRLFARLRMVGQSGKLGSHSYGRAYAEVVRQACT